MSKTDELCSIWYQYLLRHPLRIHRRSIPFRSPCDWQRHRRSFQPFDGHCLRLRRVIGKHRQCRASVRLRGSLWTDGSGFSSVPVRAIWPPKFISGVGALPFHNGAEARIERAFKSQGTPASRAICCFTMPNNPGHEFGGNFIGGIYGRLGEPGTGITPEPDWLAAERLSPYLVGRRGPNDGHRCGPVSRIG